MMYNKPMVSEGKRLSSNERGFASIIIAIVLIVVLGLITVGFAELMRREQQSATDKHLSSQAYYAAETGVNDAAKAINAGFTEAKPDCDPLPTAAAGDPAGYLDDSRVGGDANISYTCLIIDPTPPSLEYDSIDLNQSKIVLIQGVNYDDPTITEPIGKLYIGWQDSTGGQDFKPGLTKFTPTDEWTYTGMVRINLMPLYSGSLNRQTMINNNLAAYLYPNQAGGGPGTASFSYSSYTGLDSGGVFSGNCDTTSSPSAPRYCGVYVTGLNYSDYLLTLRSLYKKSKVTVVAYGLSGNQLRIKNAQTLVDSTGKAQDVVRRVQARIPTRNNSFHPDFDLEAMDNICKQLQVEPAAASSNCSP